MYLTLSPTPELRCSLLRALRRIWRVRHGGTGSCEVSLNKSRSCESYSEGTKRLLGIKPIGIVRGISSLHLPLGTCFLARRGFFTARTRDEME